MSLADSGSTSFKIVGPEGLNHYLATSRSYGMRCGKMSQADETLADMFPHAGTTWKL